MFQKSRVGKIAIWVAKSVFVFDSARVCLERGSLGEVDQVMVMKDMDILCTHV
jgi:hypothetical protein